MIKLCIYENNRNSFKIGDLVRSKLPKRTTPNTMTFKGTIIDIDKNGLCTIECADGTVIDGIRQDSIVYDNISENYYRESYKLSDFKGNSREGNPTDVEDKENMKESVYTDAGFKNRKDYLNSLASDYGIDINTVYDLASILGPDEDFDALVTELEDMADDYTGKDNITFLKELDYALQHYNYVVYDNASDEFDWWIGHFDDYKSAADNVITNLCRYNMDCVLCDTNKHLRTIYNADKLDASALNTGKANMNYYDMSYFTDDVENFIDPYLVGEDTAIENIRDILDMCEVKTEKY